MIYRYMIIGILWLVAVQATAAEQAAPSVRELLDKFAESQDKLKSCIIKSESTVFSESTYRERGGKPTQKKTKVSEACEYRTDGKRGFRSQLMWGQITRHAIVVPKERARYQSWVWDESQYVANMYAPPSADANFVFDTVLIDMSSVGRMDGKLLAVKGDIAPELSGYLESNERIDSILRKAGKQKGSKIFVHEKMEKVGGSDCYVIEASSKSGRYKIWIDPQHGYHIARSDLRRKTGDLIDNRPVAKGVSIQSGVKNVVFEKIKDVWVPMQVEVESSSNSRDGNFKSVYHIKRETFVLNPDHEGLGSFALKDVRNKAKVSITGADGVTDKTEYVWRDGQVVDSNGVKVEYKQKSAAAKKK